MSKSVRCDAKQLAAALKLTGKVACARTTVPILANVMLTAAKGELRLDACDLDMHLSVTIEGTGSLSATIPQKILASTIASGRGGFATIEAADEGDATISRDGLASSVKARTLPAGDMPAPAALGKSKASVVLAARDVTEISDRTAFAISTEETRYYLNGIYLCGHEGTLRAVATDGHRLSMLDTAVKCGPKWKPVILPTAALGVLTEAAKRGGSMKIEQAYREGDTMPRLRVIGDNWSLIARMIDGTYPDFMKLFPEKTTHSVVVKRAAFHAALAGRPKAFGKNPIQITARNDGAAMKMKTFSASLGEWEAEIPCTQTGAVKQFGFNGRYIAEIVSALGEADDAVLSYTDATAPFIITNPKTPQHKIVLMPMRI